MCSINLVKNNFRSGSQGKYKIKSQWNMKSSVSIGDTTVKVLLWTFQFKIANYNTHFFLFTSTFRYIQSIQLYSFEWHKCYFLQIYQKIHSKVPIFYFNGPKRPLITVTSFVYLGRNRLWISNHCSCFCLFHHVPCPFSPFAVWLWHIWHIRLL